jgi:dienelactone hydrolase
MTALPYPRPRRTALATAGAALLLALASSLTGWPAGAATDEARAERGVERKRIAGLVVAVWRPAGPGPAPLIVFSHGFHGFDTQSVFLTAGLARAGYLVMAPNHADARRRGVPPELGFTDHESWDDTTFDDRREDVAGLLAALRADPGWSARIDWDAVGVAGHSLGGYTGLGLAGAWPSWKLPEVRAVLALSPYCVPYLDSDGHLGELGVPVMYQGGTLDLGVTPWVRRPGGCYDSTASPAYFVELRGAGHLAWTHFEPRHHETIVRYAVSFFDEHLRGRGATLARRLPGVRQVRAK